MREIKFRLYFREGKKLTYSTHTFEVTDKRLHIMLARFDENTIVGFVQYTGLKDKNGKEIYEGDIVKCFHDGDAVGNYDVIEYNPGAFCFRYRFTTVLQWVDFDGQMEVIGNIFENPKLMATSPNHNLDDK